MTERTPEHEIHRRLTYLLDMGEREVVLNIGKSEDEIPAKDQTNIPDTVHQITDTEHQTSHSLDFDTGGDEKLEAVKAAQTLDDIESAIKSDGGCRRCKLAGGRNKIVVGAGDPNARIVFIGEGPGADEDRIGEPFVGRAGKLLDKIIAAMGLSRDNGIYICNIVKCRPPNNRDPELDEADACMPYLLRQIDLISPKVICCLGRVAAQKLLETDAALGKMRGRTHIFKGIPVLVTYHPAYLLRSPAGKKPVWEDMKELLRMADLPIPKR